MKKDAKYCKVTCLECNEYEDHILVPHIRKKHEMDPVVYLEKHGGLDKAPLWSSFGYSYIAKLHSNANVPIARPRRRIQVSKLFPDFGKRTNTIPRGKVSVFDTPGPLTPIFNEHYIFPEEQTLDLIVLLEKPQRNRAWIQGWSGTGKTDLVRNLAALVGAELLLWNLDAFQQRSHIVGHWTVKDGATVWQDGVLPRAMKQGYWCLCNELDTSNPDAMNILKPVLEDPPYLMIEETGEIISEGHGLHPDFRIIATANTWGRGDTTGLFVNTNTQSDADLRRWSGRLLLDYMPKEDEHNMLEKYFPDKLDKDEIIKFVSVANKVRDAFKAGKIDKTFSPAELINWCENFLAFGKTVHHAARVSFLQSCTPDVGLAIGEMINAVFGVESGTAKAE